MHTPAGARVFVRDAVAEAVADCPPRTTIPATRQSYLRRRLVVAGRIAGMSDDYDDLVDALARQYEGK